MILFVDADNCASLARSTLLKAAVRHSLTVVYAANHDVPFEMQNPLFKMVICPKTSGSADDYIVASCTTDDVVVTRDIPLAERLLEKKVTVMNDRGFVFDEKNIVRLLKDRELSMQLAAIGVNTGKKYNNYNAKNAGAFAAELDEVLASKVLASKVSKR